MCAVQPCEMTFTRLSAVMNALQWEGMEDTGDQGESSGGGAVG